MKIGDIIIWLVFILALAVLGWYIFGNSPTLEQAILVFAFGTLYAMTIKITKIETELRLFRKSFSNLVKDLKNKKVV